MTRLAVLSISAAVFCSLVPALAPAQNSTRKNDDRAFALVFDAQPVSYNGTDTDDRRLLKNYVEAHPGRYLVFEDRGSLYRLSDEASVAEAERQMAALQPLEAQEHALSNRQRPLEQQMRVLSEKMRAAKGPEEQSSIGEQMGELGKRMSHIGDEQGRVGDQIGTIANAFYRSAQAMFVKCLAKSSCPKL